MITAVDTSVLIDIFTPDARFGPASASALSACIADGDVVACEVVWAESAARFPSARLAGQTLRKAGIRFLPLGDDAAAVAGMAWGEYRRAGGGRERIASDFLIGAHAALYANRLLTRDRGFYRRYFAKVQIIDPMSTASNSG
jgi:predicted nucleic acid-binding protein